jgi:predicted transcriptional regulator
MATQRQKFSTQADPALLAELKALAEQEGRQFQAVMEDAMRLYLETKKSDKPRNQVMAHFQSSLRKNRELGRLLAQ